MSGSGDITRDELKNKLRVLRAERDWSQGELSVRLGVSRQAINAIETEKHDPSLELAFKMAELFGMTIEEIFLFRKGE
jgi:putative transcriptional regulator